MNTVQELVEHGIEKHTAEMMVECYENRIGKLHGINRVVDIRYIYDTGDREITLECSECGAKITRMLKSGSYKWGKFAKHCPCEKIKLADDKKRAKEEESRKIFQNKKDRYFKRIGEIRGDYKVISLYEDNGKLKHELECVECGAKKIISADYFDAMKNFHCTKHYQAIKYDESYIGQKRNYLTVMAIVRLENKHRAFLCECDCGKWKVADPYHWDVGIVKSCGCKHDELLSQASTIHGHSGDRLYNVWNNMKNRCENPNSDSYECYGERGISVCEEWRNSFQAFYDWAIKSGYDYNAKRGECTIDRIDVNGNYEPSNCRWADIITQANNKRPSSEWKKHGKIYKYKDNEYTLPELAKMFDTSDTALRYRMNVKGMTLEEALETPKMANGRPRKEKNATLNK